MSAAIGTNPAGVHFGNAVENQISRTPKNARWIAFACIVAVIGSYFIVSGRVQDAFYAIIPDTRWEIDIVSSSTEDVTEMVCEEWGVGCLQAVQTPDVMTLKFRWNSQAKEYAKAVSVERIVEGPFLLIFNRRPVSDDDIDGMVCYLRNTHMEDESCGYGDIAPY